MSTEEVIKAGVVLTIAVLQEELKNLVEDENKKKKKWIRNWIARTQRLGAAATLSKELANEDPTAYKNYLRMSPEKFDELLEMTIHAIRKQDTVMRMAIPPRTKLEITLRYLATGDSFKSLQYLFRVPECTISKFLPQVLKAITEALKNFLKVPRTTAEWTDISRAFMMNWNFPRCCGAIDGKHVQIKCPPNSGSEFFNYKGTYSIILFALVDANYCFQYVSVGANGRAGDAAIFRDSTLNIAMQTNQLGLPKDAVIIGDDAFPLRCDLMKPFSKNGLTDKQIIFNYRLSRARRVVENAFGILAWRFRVFLRPIELKTSTVDEVILSACSLHNWLRLSSPNLYFPKQVVDIEDLNSGCVTPGLWRQHTDGLQSVTHFGINNSTNEAKKVRNLYADYFMGDGSLPWQWNRVGITND